MKASIVLERMFVVAGLLTGAAGFVLQVHIATGTGARQAGGLPLWRRGATTSRPSPPFRQAGGICPPATSANVLLAKVTHQSFEDMIQKEPEPILVDFYATWCGPCRMMGEALKEVTEEMKGEVKVMKMDSDAHPSLTKKFGVIGLPTLILFKDGKELHRMEGFSPATRIIEQVRYYLQRSTVTNAAAAGPIQQEACPPSLVDNAAAASGSRKRDECALPTQDACSPPQRDTCAPSSP